MQNSKVKIQNFNSKFKIWGRFSIFSLSFSFLIFNFYISGAQAQSANTPAVTLNSPVSSENILSANFSLFGPEICDGPPGGPKTTKPCDFNAAMREVQHLINVFIVLGVLAAIVGFSWAGFLYVTGGANPGKISKAHSIFINVALGFIIMLSAWFIVYQILAWLTGEHSGFGALLGPK